MGLSDQRADDDFDHDTLYLEAFGHFTWTYEVEAPTEENFEPDLFLWVLGFAAAIVEIYATGYLFWHVGGPAGTEELYVFAAFFRGVVVLKPPGWSDEVEGSGATGESPRIPRRWR